MDISALTLSQLKDLLAQIPAEIKRREKDEKAKALKDLEALAAERGFSLSDLLGDSSSKAKKEKGSVAVKYRHPENVDLAWTGRGRQPKWVIEFLASGGSLDNLTV